MKFKKALKINIVVTIALMVIAPAILLFLANR